MNNSPRDNRRRPGGHRRRKGSVTVELAFVIPVFMVITLGALRTGHVVESQNVLATAAREGARLSGMNRSNLLGPGQTTNSKIEQDIKNIVSSAGLPGDQVDVFINYPDDPGTTFDLDDPANKLEMFEIRVKMPMSAINGYYIPGTNDVDLEAKLIFRNAPATLSD